jgi:hypothetical protein
LRDFICEHLDCRVVNFLTTYCGSERRGVGVGVGVGVRTTYYDPPHMPDFFLDTIRA